MCKKERAVAAECSITNFFPSAARVSRSEHTNTRREILKLKIKIHGNVEL